MSLQSAYLQRGVVVRAAAALGLLAIALFVLPHTAGADWITTFTSVAIYSVVALGFGILYGRVGLISLGQVALLTIGCWIGTRLAYATSLPFPVLLLLAGAHHLRDRGPRRPAGAAPLGPVPRADHADVRGRDDDRPLGDRLPERRRRVHGPLEHGRADDEHAARAPPVVGGRRRRVLPLHGDRLRDPLPARARARRRQAGPRLGDDPRERAGRARRRRQHHPLQAVGVRARLVRDRRGRVPARGPGRCAPRDHLPDPGLADARRDRADRRHLQPLGRSDRRDLQPGAAVPLPGAVGPEPELPADPLRRRPAAGAADRARRSRQPVPEGHGQSCAADLRRLPQAGRGLEEKQK